MGVRKTTTKPQYITSNPQQGSVRIDGGDSNHICFPHCKEARVVPDPVSAVAARGAPSFALFHSSIGSFETVDCIFKDDENKIYAMQMVVSRSHYVGSTATEDLQATFGDGFTVGLYCMTPAYNIYNVLLGNLRESATVVGGELSVWSVGVKFPEKYSE
jgi:hypothetical protein